MTVDAHGGPPRTVPISVTAYRKTGRTGRVRRRKLAEKNRARPKLAYAADLHPRKGTKKILFFTAGKAQCNAGITCASSLTRAEPAINIRERKSIPPRSSR